MEDRLLNIRQASQLLNLAVPTIYKMVCSKKILVIRLNGRVLFSEKRLSEWIKDHTVEPICSKGD
jgi:excisionase family DNA binding protein